MDESMLGAGRKRKSLTSGTYQENGGEVLHWSYYDSYALLSTVNTNRLFTTGLSGGRRIDQTNLPIGGQIPGNQRFDVHCIRAFYTAYTLKNNAALLAWYKFLTHTTLEFIINGKASSLTVGLNELFGMPTLFGEVPTVAGDNISIPQPKPNGVYMLKPKIPLAASTNFEVKVISQVATDASLDTDILKISLGGILTYRS